MPRATLFVARRVRRFFAARDAAAIAETAHDAAKRLYLNRIGQGYDCDKRHEISSLGDGNVSSVVAALKEDVVRTQDRRDAARAELATAEAALRELEKEPSP